MALLDVSRYARHRRISSTEIYLHTDLSDLARQVNKAHRPLEELLAEEAISAQVLVTVSNLLSLLPEGTKTKGRQDLIRLQTSFC